MSDGRDEVALEMSSSPSPFRPAASIGQYLDAQKSDEFINQLTNKNTRKYYETQNEMIRALADAQRYLDVELGTSSEHVSPNDIPNNGEGSNGLPFHWGGPKWAINGSFGMNCVLVVFKIVAAVLSGSLVVLASTVDSALDIFSGAIIFVTHIMIHRQNKYLYPVGKNRYENLGIIVFAAVMGFSSLQVIITSIKDIIDNFAHPPAEFELSAWAFGVLGCAIVVKTILMFWCAKFRHTSSSCDALRQDHFNDICSNSMSLVFLLIAHYSGAWWLDPTGAVLLSLYIIVNWVKMGHHHLTLLVGKIADVKTTAKLTYYASHFDPLIEQVDTVRAYHAGLQLIVELDVIMPPETPLKQAHDVGEALQMGLEKMDEVERAFVHLDYEGRHKPEH